ncbi:hypothetical protein Pmani_006563 [Petrolisthes manimaculis]|uniref:Uncharacterized protein n=1 Tax=Petrolisthes manimaculis TaxID=1843537 RepID=A0AAE1QCJ3_9EUCA|nr:hypothetical protein Pmani_006563 [Petrolisthes manimaculis]
MIFTSGKSASSKTDRRTYNILRIMLAWFLTITLVVLAHSEPKGNDVQEERWDPLEMASSEALDTNDKTSRRFWCPSFFTSCFRNLGGICMRGAALEEANCDFVAPSTECSSWSGDCSCCIKCSDSGMCLANGGQCQMDRVCPPEAYIDVLSPCASPSACVCCQKCIQTSTCIDGGESNDTGLCTGNADTLLLMDEYYEPSPGLDCDDGECSCVLKCGGDDCERNEGMCIKKTENCPEGYKNNRQAKKCGCNNSDTCMCCLPIGKKSDC